MAIGVEPPHAEQTSARRRIGHAQVVGFFRDGLGFEVLADLTVAVLNPRRDAWEQSIRNPLFRGQVEWELDGLERASVIAMYFAPTTRAPVTLLEFGLMARSGKLVVCCPPGFWWRGNVEVLCARFGVPLVEDLSGLVQSVRNRILADPGGATRPAT